jgi:hypothetical protein
MQNKMEGQSSKLEQADDRRQNLRTLRWNVN